MNGVPSKFISASLILAVVLLFAAMFHSYKLVEAYEKNNKLVTRDQQLLDFYKKLSDNVRDGEISVHEYVLSGNESFLKPYHISLEKNLALTTGISELVKNNPAEQSQYDEIKSLAQEAYAFMDKSIDIKNKQGMEASIALANTHEGASIIDALDEKLAAVKQAGQQISEKTAQEALDTQKATKQLAVAEFALSLALFIMVFYKISRQAKMKMKDQEINKEHKEWFMRTLYNLGDGVITTDKNYVITYMNPIAENLTGWAEIFVKGKPIDFVFNIINEKTRQKLENPVYATIATRKGINLSADALLIRRDGTEIHIDESCSPIISEKGQLLGAALVFRDVSDVKEKTNDLAKLNTNLERSIIEKTTELEESQVRWRKTLDNLMEGVQIIGYDWQYLYVNNKVLEDGHYKRDELIGYTMPEKYPGIENSGFYKLLNLSMQNRESKKFEYLITSPNKSRNWFELSVEPIEEGLFILSMNIDNRKKAEAEKVEYMDSLEKMIYLTSHTIRHPVTQLMGIALLLKHKTNTPEELGQLRDYMTLAVQSLDTLTRELSDFIYEAKKQRYGKANAA